MTRGSWRTAALLALASCCVGSGAQTITLHSLLQEMTDRDALARFPSPAYRQLQGSTYNRASVARDQPDQTAAGWFADNDGAFYIRAETNALGGTEFVVMEHEGPGCITRLWTPFFYQSFANRTGPDIRIYLGGSTTPVIDENLIELVTRLEWSTNEYGAKPPPQNAFAVPSPLAGFTARAGNSYLPIPFASGCKVTVSAAPFYDIVSYRAYEAGTVVEDFTPGAYASASNQAQLAATAAALSAPSNFAAGARFETTGNMPPGGTIALTLGAGPAAVRHLEIQLDPMQLRTNPAALRSTVLVVTCDGEETVWCPLGDFFCSADALHPLETWTHTVTTNDALLVSRWVMPYASGARIALANLGTQALSGRMAARTDSWSWDERSLHFHAGWRPDDLQVGSQFTDWTLVDVRGKGVLVGDAWTVLNRTAGWWGEGDEKIYVDDEYDAARFPGIFGTGTEDYYGWAGGVNPTKADEFLSPFLANVLVGSAGENSTRGFNINTRVRALDAVPFTRRLVFDMEASPGTGQRNPWDLLMYSAVTFWYARPGAADNLPAQPDPAVRPITGLGELNQLSEAIHHGTNAAATARARWNLGEQDAGAAGGGPGHATTADALGSHDLARFGAPVYSTNVPPGGSALSLSFDGTNDFYQGSGAAFTSLYAAIDFNNVRLACDVFLTGVGSQGFSFPASVGGSGTGLAVVESGGRWRIIHHNVALSALGPAVTPHAWTHLELVRRRYDSGVQTRLFVNGVDAGVSLTAALIPPAGAFYVGANRVPGGPEGRFKGQIDNVELTSLGSPMPAGLTARLDSGRIRVDCLGTPGVAYMLWHSPSLNTASWSTLARGIPGLDGVVALPDAFPSNPAAFYRVTSF